MKKGITFEEWKRHVNEIVQTMTGGLSLDDIPDVDYRELYDMGESPGEVARIALDEAGWTPTDGV